MKKVALALALAMAISPLTFAKKTDTSSKMHQKGTHAKKQWRPGPNGVSFYKY